MRPPREYGETTISQVVIRLDAVDHPVDQRLEDARLGARGMAIVETVGLEVRHGGQARVGAWGRTCNWPGLSRRWSAGTGPSSRERAISSEGARARTCLHQTVAPRRRAFEKLRLRDGLRRGSARFWCRQDGCVGKLARVVQFIRVDEVRDWIDGRQARLLGGGAVDAGRAIGADDLLRQQIPYMLTVLRHVGRVDVVERSDSHR